MTLDEAIKHYEEKAKRLRHIAELDVLAGDGYDEDLYTEFTEYEQLVEWLKELRNRKAEDELKVKAYRW